MSVRALSVRALSVHAMCGWLALVSPLATAPASAQAPSLQPSTNTHARVDELLRQGIQSREAGRDAEALDHYRRAAALEPENPRVLAHLGATYHALGRWVSAHTYLLQALQYRDDPYIQRHASELQQALSLVADHIGFLEVYGAPPGAQALLNGQLVAALPTTAPVPVTVGSYMLEVRLANHYTLGRPITIAPRVLTREEVELAPHPSETEEARPVAPASTGAVVRAPDDEASTATRSDPRAEPAASSGGSAWPWVFGGLSAAAAVTSVVAWERREHHAERWNDDGACLGVGISRGERCGAELELGQRAETVLWVSGVAAGALAVGAVLSIVLASPSKPDEGVALRCAPEMGGAACFGTF